MGYVNKKSKGMREKAHANFMGGPSYELTPLLRLRVAASSCFFGEPMYYHRDKKDTRPRRYRSGDNRYLHNDEVAELTAVLQSVSPKEWRGKTPSELMEYAIDAALDADPEATLKFAVELRNEFYIRVTPQAILVRAAMHPKVRGTGLIRIYAMDIIVRADEMATGLAYYLSKSDKKKSIPNSLKRAWRDAFGRFNEYQLAKYRMESREVKTVDVANLVHPKGELVDKLVKGELKTTGETWEAIISAEGSNAESWRKAMSKMGHMALLRNIRNLIQHEVSETEWIGKLITGAEKGKQLPFRYFSAYRAVKDAGASGKVLDAIEACLEQSIGNLPKFPGKVMSLTDNSGSACGTAASSMGTMRINEIGNLMGVLTGKVADEGWVGVFGDRYEKYAIRQKSSVFDALAEINKAGESIGGGTEHGIWLFWDSAIKNKEHWDYVFVYSDMQAGHGGLYGNDVPSPWCVGGRRGCGTAYIDVPKLIAEYRNKVNPDVQVFLVQTAGYQDTIIPEFFNKTYILGGWSDKVLHFAAEMASVSKHFPKLTQ